MDTNRVLKALFNVLALSAVAAAAFSCTVRQLDEDLQSAPSGERLEFTASIEDEAQTRSSVDANLNFYWNPGDQVNLFYGPSGNTPGSLFTSQNTQTAQSSTFSGTISAFTGTGNDGEMLAFWGVSPYRASNRFDGSSVQVTLPSVQQAVAENFASNTMLMVAKSPGLSLSFKHVGTMIRIRMSRSDIISVTFQGNAGETLAGRVSVTMDSSGKPAWSPIEGQGSQSVRLDKPDGFVAGTYYYLYFLPQTFAQGWSLTFETRDGQTGTYTSHNSITFARAAASNANGLDARVTTWEAGYVEMAPGFFWAKKNVGAHSPEGYGDFFAWGETSPKGSYTESNYDYLLPFSDAATEKMGDGWRTPTAAECNALLNEDNYTWVWMALPGVNGYKVTSKVPGYEGNSIFLPAADLWSSTMPSVFSHGYYWSSSLDPTDSRYSLSFIFSSSYIYFNSSFSTSIRYFGKPIRAIYDPSSVPPVSPEVPVTGVSFDMETYAMLDRGTFALPVTISPSNATIQDLTWVSSNPSVAVVSPTGVVTGKSVGTTTITTRTVDGGYRAACIVKVIPNTSYIDMGNGTKWASCNVGAESPEEYGGYFAWGETQTKTGSYNWSTYQYCTGGSESSINKYTPTDGKTVLEAGDDAATVNLGSNWRMATDAEWTWLLENCTWTWCEMNGVKGCLVTSNVTGNASIFLPAAGNKVMSQTGNVGTRGRYWTSSADGLKSWSVDISADGPIHESAQRIRGYSVRGVYEPKQFINGHEYVEMGDGLKWATCNVGASSPGEYGDYFAWGETEPKSSYSSESYDYNRTFSDAAAANWGSTWRMPTVEEWRALMNSSNFDWEWDEVRKGCKVTSKVSGYEGNSIFLPAAGWRFYSRLEEAGSYGDYWTPSRYQYDDGEYDDSDSNNLFIKSDGASITFSDRSHGMSVRPVSD